MNKVLVFGSLNIDIVYSLDHIVKPGETLLSSALEKNAGGKGLNQASAIARTGLPVYMAGKVGEDGRFLLDTLSSFSVDTTLVDVVPSPSGNAIIERSRDGQNSIILFAGTNREITPDIVEKTLSSFGEGDVLVLQNEINALDEIIERASAKGMYIVLNPAPFDSSVFSLPLEKVNLLVVNEIEGAALAGMNEDEGYERILKAIMGHYPENEVVLTCGANGAYWGKGEETIFAPAFKVKAVDTTAAGDTFIGYFLASRLLGYSTKESLTYAAKASSIAVTRIGAAKSVPLGEEVFEK